MSICPNCGFCPHCRRSNNQPSWPIPYTLPYTPPVTWGTPYPTTTVAPNDLLPKTFSCDGVSDYRGL